MKTAWFIAWRYLFAPKQRQVINVISWISAVGIALGTMALVIVLSVYNGFDNLVKGMYHSFDSDLLIRPSHGKSFEPGEAFATLQAHPKVASLCGVIEEQVFLQYGSEQAVATLKGVDSVFMAVSPLKEYVVRGSFDLQFGEIEQAVMGHGLALKLGVNVHFVDPLWLNYPKKDVPFSPLAPLASLERIKVFPAGVFAVEQQYDSQYLLIRREVAAALLSYGNRWTYAELRVAQPKDAKPLQKEVQRLLGSDFEVLNRYQQNETLYKMMTTEKMAIFVILGFIVLIISCNVLSSLSMLLMEKKDDIRMLESMGATPRFIRRVFLIEGWLISLLGLAAGMIAGLMVCFLQMTFGLVPLPGSFVVDAYPVAVQVTDLLLITLTVMGLGFLAAYAPSRSIATR